MKNLGKVILAESDSEWVALCAKYIIRTIHQILSEKENVNIGLSGGRSPISIFTYINDNKAIEEETWEKVNFYWIDERVVPFEDNQNNAGNAMRILKSIPANYYPINTSLGSPAVIAGEYDKLLRENLPETEGVPTFDLVLLGMGEDGHIASLFPDTAALHETQKAVVENYVEKLDSDRITVTYPVLNTASDTLVIIRGSEKKDVIHQLMLREGNYPIEGVLENDNERTWIINSI